MSGPRVLSDFHHHALAESLIALFGDRYGGTVAFPWGMGWFDRWYWSFERPVHGDAVARQYLEGIWAGARQLDEGHVERDDPRYPGRVHHGVSLDAALAEPWDFVVCSLPHNYNGFAKLARETGARYVVQLGNDTQEVDPAAQGALVSTTLPGRGPEFIGRRFDVAGVPAVMYHQEFSLDTFAPAWPPADRRTVASFVNCYPETWPYPDFLRLARAQAAEFDWRVYGAYGSAEPDELAAGDLSVVEEVAQAMRATRTAWHTKAWSDGFGHVIHNWFAIGRPVLGYRRFYADKLAAPLWREGVTAFDVEGLDDTALVALLSRLRDDDDFHREVCEAGAARFREVVDFGAEADAIGEMLALGVPVPA